MACRFIFCLLISTVVDDFDHELHYVASLRQAQFFQLSNRHAEQLRARDGLTPPQRSQLVVEMSKTLAAQALNSRSPDRDTFWARSTSVLAEEARKQDDPASKLVLQAQQAFVFEQQSAWSVREAEIRSTHADDWKSARDQIRRAIKALKQVEQTLTTPEIRQQQSIPDAQIQSIQRNTQFKLGSAYLNQAIAYGDNSRDRTNALTQAMEYFQSLAANRQIDELVWKSRVSQVRCTRMLGQLTNASRLLKQWSSAPANQLGSLAAESIRLALSAQQLESALQLANIQSIDSNDPEFQLARIEALVAAFEQLKGQPRAKEFQQQASAAVADLAKRHGTYWALRGELMLSRLALNQNADANMLDAAADTMLRRDAPESAKEMLLRAAEQLDQQDQESSGKAFDFLYKAAVIDHQEGHLAAAIEQFRNAANKHPQHPQAAEAHLLAVFDAAGLYQQYAANGADKQQLSGALSLYDNLLSEHIATWPTSATSDQARIWAAKLALARREWMIAADLYRNVSVDSEFERQAYQGYGRATTQWIAAVKPPVDAINQHRSWLKSRLPEVRSNAARSTNSSRSCAAGNGPASGLFDGDGVA